MVSVLRELKSMLDNKYPTFQETWRFGTLLTRLNFWTILSQMNPTDHNYNNLLYAIYFNSVLQIYDYISLPFRFYTQNLGVFFYLPHVCYIPCLSHFLNWSSENIKDLLSPYLGLKNSADKMKIGSCYCVW